MASNPIPQLEQKLQAAFPCDQWLPWRTVVAVSGGPDSVALLRAMTNLAVRSAEREDTQKPTGNLIVVHINHQTRQNASDADADFVNRLANRLGLEFHQSPAPESPMDQASEEQLRNFRYQQLTEHASKLGARYIVTGHQFDDQVETILFRIFRGTGIAGLAGIPPMRLVNDSITLVRPLLDVTREEVENYLATIDQPYRHDSSNANPKYTRNFLRHEILPTIKQRFGDSVPKSIARLGTQARETQEFIETQLDILTKSITSHSANHFAVDCEPWSGLPPILARQAIIKIWQEKNWPMQAMSFQWWQTICEQIITAPKQSVLNLPAGVRFERTGSTARFQLMIDE